MDLSRKITFAFIALAMNLYGQAENPFLFDLSSHNNFSVPELKNRLIHTNEHFELYSEYNSSSGSFRRFVDPSASLNAVVGFKGFKVIDDDQSFRGEFKVFKQIRRNWNWIFVRDYQGFNPNLIGDSTSGTSRYNGIEMSADYNYRFNSTDAVNAKLSYLVDEGLKQITPRPVSEHRDIKFELNGSYGFLKSFTADAGVVVGDLNESISYREDEGGVTQETILLKFSGIDLPTVVRKKTESRYQYLNLYGGNFKLNWLITDGLKTSFGYSGTLIKSIQKDDALDPRLAGYFRSLSDKVNFDINYALNQSNTFKLNIEYNNGLDWSRAPERNVLYSEIKNNKLSADLSHEYVMSGELILFYGLQYSIYQINYDDYYSGAFLYKKKNTVSGKAGFSYYLSEDLSFAGNLYYGADHHIDGYINLPSAATGYFAYRRGDLQYLYADLNYFGISAEAKIKISRGNYLYPRAGFSLLSPQNGYFSSGTNQFYINISYLTDI